MRKIIVYIAASLDGYIADSKGDVSWLAGDGSDEENPGSYPAFIKTVDTVILGYTTYHQIISELSPDVWPYDGKECYVLTHKKLENQGTIIFTDEDIAALAERLKAEDGKDIWICGGASVINQFQRLGLIDEYTVSVIPTILGNGVRLFDEQEKEQKLQLLSINQFNGMVNLTYRKRQ